MWPSAASMYKSVREYKTAQCHTFQIKYNFGYEVLSMEEKLSGTRLPIN
jgi:hypothetical protein